MKAGITFKWLLMLVLGISVVMYLGCEAEDHDDAADDDTGDDDDDDTGDDDDDDSDDDDDDDSDDDDDMSETWPTSFAGSLVYNDSYDGVEACNMAVDLVGTKFTGTCSGCDFAFDVEATVTDDQSTADCAQVSYFTWVYDGGIYIPLMMAHLDSYTGSYGNYTNMFRTGVAIDYSSYGGGYYPGPYFATISYDGSPYGTFTRTGDDIEWTFSRTSDVDVNALEYPYAYQNCGTVDSSAATTNLGGDWTGTSDLDCLGEIVDVWSFEGDSIGSTYAVSVDTVSDADAFDPHFYLNDATGCSVMYTDDNFDCTFEPAAYYCPSGEIVVTEGTHYVIVMSYGSCNGTDAAYEILVDAPADPTLTLVLDNTSLTMAQEYILEFSGSGTITP